MIIETLTLGKIVGALKAALATLGAEIAHGQSICAGVKVGAAGAGKTATVMTGAAVAMPKAAAPAATQAAAAKTAAATQAAAAAETAAATQAATTACVAL